jgi:tripartite-type tricarboxylate transporter receptor subunit TctC
MKVAGTASVAATMGLAGCSGGGNGGDGGGGSGGSSDGGSGGSGDGGGSSGGGDGGDGDSSGGGSSESEYPESGSTVEYIVPFSEGGGTDTYARQIMGKVSEILDINVRINNVPGGASLRGTAQIANADPDGYTMGGFNPPSTPLSYLVFEPDFDLTEVEGVCTYATTPYTIIANADQDIGSMGDLIERYNSGDFEALGGCQAQGGLNHVAALVMQDTFDFNWTNYVGYDGCAPAGQAVASGEIPATIGSDLAIEGVVSSGRADVVSILMSGGSTVFPDAPSLTDEGYENIDYIGGLNRAMWMPPGTDRERVDIMAAAVEEAMASDDLQQWSEESGNGLTFGGPDAANSLLQNSLEQIPQRVDIEAIREAATE